MWGGPKMWGVKKQRPESHPRAAPGSLSWQSGERAAPGWGLDTSPGRSPDWHLTFPFGPSLASCPPGPSPHPSPGLSGLDLFIQMDQEIGPA